MKATAIYKRDDKSIRLSFGNDTNNQINVDLSQEEAEDFSRSLDMMIEYAVSEERASRGYQIPVCEEEGEIIIKEISYCGSKIVFKEGQELKVEYSKYQGEDFINITYDFGMETKDSMNKNKNWLMHGYDGLDKSPTMKEFVRSMVKFDVEHAFLHPDIDPNYGSTHWAIRGYLKDRVTIAEDPDDQEDKWDENP
jgi:hypothetical protein